MKKWLNVCFLQSHHQGNWYKDAVQISMTDVINRLHHLKGEDRFHLIMEFMEWFCLEDEEILEYRGNN